MSMAPRPHTSPLISSPPKGSRVQCAGVTGTTSVWPIRHSVGASGSLLDAGDEAGASGRALRLIDFDVEAAAREIGLRQVGGAHLPARGHAAVIDALVADHLLEQLDGLRGEGVVHDLGV